jgi:cytochrome P450
MGITTSPLARKLGTPVLLFKERLSSGVGYDLLSPAQREDPYPIYRAMQEKDPVHWSELARAWFLVKYEDISNILRDPRFRVRGTLHKSNERMGVKLDETTPFGRVTSQWMLMVDPPDHTRLRNLINRALTPRAIEAMRPRIQELVDDLLDRVQDKGEMDVVRDLADPLPAMVLATLLDIPPGDHVQLKKWADIVGMGIDPVFGPDLLQRINTTVETVWDYFRPIIAERRKNPGDDLLSALIIAEDQGNMLTEQELLSMMILLLAAGTETTTNLTSSGLYLLLTHPDEMQRLRASPDLMETAIEEILRYETPVQLTGRIVTEDMELRGKRLRTGQPVGLLLGAANRDPDQFENPDVFDITRNPNRHAAFSYGPHFCVGAPLGRAEGQIAIGTVLRRFPNLKLATDRPQWRVTLNNRGPKTLPVTF